MIGSLIYIGISYQLAAMTLHFRLSYPMNINLQESNTLALFSGVSYVRLLLFQPLTVFNWKSLGKYVSSSNKNIIHLPHADFYAIYSFFEFFFHSSNHLAIPTYSFFQAFIPVTSSKWSLDSFVLSCLLTDSITYIIDYLPFVSPFPTRPQTHWGWEHFVCLFCCNRE